MQRKRNLDSYNLDLCGIRSWEFVPLADLILVITIMSTVSVLPKISLTYSKIEMDI